MQQCTLLPHGHRTYCIWRATLRWLDDQLQTAKDWGVSADSRQRPWRTGLTVERGAIVGKSDSRSKEELPQPTQFLSLHTEGGWRTGHAERMLCPGQVGTPGSSVLQYTRGLLGSGLVLEGLSVCQPQLDGKGPWGLNYIPFWYALDQITIALDRDFDEIEQIV
ncbi:hypothetical protein CIB48_g9073 [Xylaria polymorpha]|nr:hypothetical protein CIB48_g9073 [Xylaria polymorpha]